MQRRSDQIPSSVDLSSAWNYESVSVFICVNYAGSQLCEMVCSAIGVEAALISVN